MFNSIARVSLVRLGLPRKLDRFPITPIVRFFTNKENHESLTEEPTIKDLSLALHNLADKTETKFSLATIEEQLLTLLTSDRSDIVASYLSIQTANCYESLCDTFIGLAKNRRRRVPLLRALAIELCKKSITKATFYKPKDATIIETLKAVAELKYPNRMLVSKLMGDLKDVINPCILTSNSISSLLRSSSSINWRPDEILGILYKYIMRNNAEVSNNVIIDLLFLSAVTNYRFHDLEKFYESHVKLREKFLNNSTRKWLNYTWSLAVLGLVKEHHLRSILQSDYYNALNESWDTVQNFLDIQKLLNLKAIANLEFKMSDIDTHDMMENYRNQRSSINQRMADKIVQALRNIADEPACLQLDYQTPFGFMVDCEILLDENLNFHPFDLEDSMKDLIMNGRNTSNLSHPNLTRCALIYTDYEDIITNSQGEVCGSKRLISRILGHYGYKTVYLIDSVLNREKTSADFVNKIKSIIRSSVNY